MENIKVKEIMNKNIITVDIDTTIVQAAKLMNEHNIGFLPVLNKGNIVGVLTDRDIITKIISGERDIYASVFLAMNTNIISVNKNDDISIAITKMADHQIRRIVVLNNNHELKGIITLADIANNKEIKSYLPELIYEILLPESKDLLLINDTSVLV